MVAVVSDIHGNLEAFESVIKDIKSNPEVTRIFCLGDMIDYGADSSAVVHKFDILAQDYSINCVRGNHEEAVLTRDCSRFTTEHGRQNFEITLKEIYSEDGLADKIKSMTSSYRLCILNYGAEGVCLVHGTETDCYWGKHGRLSGSVTSLHDIDKRVVLCGHSHLQGWKFEEESNSILINPGSVGQPRNGDSRAQYLLCDNDFHDFYFKRVDYDVKTASQKIKDSGRPRFLYQRLLFGI